MTPPGTLDGREPTFDLARISRPRISLARRFALLRCTARPQARAQPHHVASCTPLGPKRQAQAPVWLARSFWSSTGPIQANLSYIVKMAIFAPSVGHHGRPSGNLPAPPLVFPIHFGPIDHGNTFFFGRFLIVKNQLVAHTVGTHTVDPSKSACLNKKVRTQS